MFLNYTRYCLCTILLAVLAAPSCRKADRFYEEMEDILQVAGDSYSYRSTYLIGDTIYFYGRFGTPDNDLRIRIGDADGRLVSRSYVQTINDNQLGDVWHDKTLQLVKVPVEETMGTGPDRQVRFSLGARTLAGSPVYIRKAGAAAVFTDTLNLKLTGFDFAGAKRYFIESWNGTGRVFYFNYENNSLNVWKDSVSTGIPVTFEDELDEFTITTVYAANVDRTEKLLYFCASTKNISSGTTIQRFCKIDLATAELFTLNTTASMSGGPWEGPIGDVKLPVIRFLYVAENGRAYFHTGTIYRTYLTSAIGKIDEGNNVGYLTGSLSGTTISNPRIVFSNPGGGGSAAVGPVGIAIDPDRGLFYHLSYVDTYNPMKHHIVNVYDLVQQREVNSFVPEHADIGVEMILDAPFEAAKYDQGGTWFLQQGKPVFFLADNNARNIRSAAVVVDFESKETHTYAPFFTFPHGTAIFDRTVLNYTPEGHVIFRRQYKLQEPDYPLSTLEITEIKN